MYIFSTGYATARHMFLALGLRMVFAGAGILLAGGALSRAVSALRRGLGRQKEDPQAPADWSDVRAEDLPRSRSSPIFSSWAG